MHVQLAPVVSVTMAYLWLWQQAKDGAEMAALARYHSGRFMGGEAGKVGMETAVAAFKQLGLAWETELAELALLDL